MNKKSPNPTDRHIGQRVRIRRMALGMSQEKLGEKLGITFQQIQKYEKGTNRIGGSRMQQIATALNVPPAFFFEGAPQSGAEMPPENANINEFLATHDGLRIVKAFARIEGPQRRLLAESAEAFAR